MFKFFCRGGDHDIEAPQKKPTPIRTEKPLPHLEKKVAKRNQHGEKVAIAPPWAPAEGGGKCTRLPTVKFKKIFFTILVHFWYFFSMWEPFFAYGGGGLF